MFKKLRTLLVALGAISIAGLLCGAALPTGGNSKQIPISRVNTVTSGDVPLTTNYFEDTKFINFLKQYDDDGNGKLSDTELKDITEIKIYSSSNITSVLGIANLRYLTKFVTYSNTLTVLDLTSCPKLEYVDFSDTPVTTYAIDLSPNVKEVICDRSKIWRSETPLSSEKLQKVSFVGCTELTKIIYQDMPSLTEITCNNCSKLTKINIKNCSELLEIDISDSENINDLEVTGCRKLKQLFMSSMNGGDMLLFPETLVLDDTQIASYFPVENFRGMKHCSLRGIKVSGTMDLKHNPNLVYLDLDGAKYISVEMAQLDKITHLSLNQVASVQGFDESKCPALEYLDLSSSSLTSIDLSKMPDLEVFIANDTNLTSIDYTKNPALKTLSLRNTMIESIVDYAGKSVIWNLDVSYCTKLKNVSVKLVHCREFDVSNCPILTSAFIDASNGLSKVNVKNSSSLKELIIHGGRESYKALDFTGAPNIETLEVRDSHVTNFDLAHLPNLKSITLGGLFYYFNEAEDKILDISSCKNLEEARIEDFSCKTVKLEGLTKLTTFYCLDNKFTDVDLSSCTSLKELYISGDKNLTQLDVSTLSNLELLSCKNDSIKKLDVSKNKKLEKLNCVGNGLKDIVFPDNFGLLNVTCYDNDLDVLNVYQCYALVDLVTMFPPKTYASDANYSYYYKWDTSDIGLRFDTKTKIISEIPTLSVDLSSGPYICTSGEALAFTEIMANRYLCNIVEHEKNLYYVDLDLSNTYDVSFNTLTGEMTRLSTGSIDGTFTYTEQQLDEAGVRAKEFSFYFGNLYAISYLPNGGTGRMKAVKVYEGDPLVLPKCTIKAPEGMVFDCWDAGAEGDTIIVKEHMAIKALWKAIIYSVTVTNDGNGTASASVTSGAMGTEVTLKAVPNKGYRLKTWKVLSGGVKITNDKFTIGTEDVKIQAIFVKGTPTPTPTTAPGKPTPKPGDPTPTTAPGQPTPKPGDPTPTTAPGQPTPKPGDPTPTTAPGQPTPKPGDPTPKPGDPTPTPDPEKEPSIADFVERLYTIALNRPSEPEGKAFWVNEIESGNRTGGDCAHFFLIEAPEFLNRGLNEDDFVETLYLTFFDRASEAAGKKFWVDGLKSGKMTKEYVINGFIDSTEWCNVCATYGVKSGAPHAKAEFASKNAIKFATRLYTCCLGRDPEEGGLNYWSLALTNLEQTGCSAAKNFFKSEEFVNFKLKDDEYVRRLYTTFMGRDPEASEIAYWVGEINKGTQTKDSVMAFFGSSEEFTNICKQYGIDRGTI
ncbi:MAG: DUF4214 domain-containing protein [Clostridiales bacterium]|nr:DUF4214 domain-containing protein [Clostridiales bacterium]